MMGQTKLTAGEFSQVQCVIEQLDSYEAASYKSILHDIRKQMGDLAM